MDELAATGTLFQRAYVQYSFCAPSRNSFLTGRRPDATQAWSFMDHFRERGVGDQWTTLPEYFRTHGYWTVGAGKLFHPGLPPNFDAADAAGNKLSFDEFYYPGSCSGTTNGFPVLQDGAKKVVRCVDATSSCPSSAMTAGDGKHWCALDVDKLDAPLQDTLSANRTVQWLHEAKARADADIAAGNAPTPFFLGVGFHKPHLPFQYPSTMHGLYPPAEEIAQAKHPDSPKGMPMVAWHEGNFDNTYTTPCIGVDQSTYRRAYYTAVSFTDNNVGVVLGALKDLGFAGNTVVSLIGDHGWQLGEMNLWRKMTNFELGVRVPLIIRAPWHAASIGVKSPLLVEAVDLFATLADVAGLPAPPATEKLEGRSFAAVFETPTSATLNATFKYAFSQFAKRLTKAGELPGHVRCVGYLAVDASRLLEMVLERLHAPFLTPPLSPSTFLTPPSPRAAYGAVG
jgi:arylsulfatase A-like enzyme